MQKQRFTYSIAWDIIIAVLAGILALTFFGGLFTFYVGLGIFLSVCFILTSLRIGKPGLVYWSIHCFVWLLCAGFWYRGAFTYYNNMPDTTPWPMFVALAISILLIICQAALERLIGRLLFKSEEPRPKSEASPLTINPYDTDAPLPQQLQQMKQEKRF